MPRHFRVSNSNREFYINDVHETFDYAARLIMGPSELCGRQEKLHSAVGNKKGNVGDLIDTRNATQVAIQSFR